MTWSVAVAGLAACGRIGFDALVVPDLDAGLVARPPGDGTFGPVADYQQPGLQMVTTCGGVRSPARVVVLNVGDQDLILRDLTLSGGFTIAPNVPPASIPPGGDTAFVVTPRAAIAGVDDPDEGAEDLIGELSFHTNSPITPLLSVPLVATLICVP